MNFFKIFKKMWILEENLGDLWEFLGFCEGELGGFYFLQKQNEAKTFMWILRRLCRLSMTGKVVVILRAIAPKYPFWRFVNQGRSTHLM